MSGDLAGVHEVWAGRSTARGTWAQVELLYLVVISVLVLVVPALGSVGGLLARPDVLPLLLAPAAPTVAVLAVAVAAAGAVLVGGTRGPALLDPFLTTALAGSALRRRTVLSRPAARALLVPLGAGLLTAAVVGTVLLEADVASGAEIAALLVAATGTGLLLGLCWLAGELLAPAARPLLALGVLALGIVLALPGQAGPAALIPGPVPAGAVPWPWALGIAAAGLLAAVIGWALLDRLRGAVLLEQSLRWDAARTSADTGDLAGAAAGFRSPPRAGRRLPAVGPGPLALVYARRDAVAWLRSPGRSALGAIGVIAGAALLTAGTTLVTGPAAVIAVLVGTLSAWLGSGPFVDGLRHAVHTLGAPALFGQSAPVQAVLHLIAPTLLVLLLAAAGTVPVALLDPRPLEHVAPALLLALLLVPARLRDAAKGPMPLALTVPLPTAQGDASVLPLLAWQSDALLLALATGGALVLAAGLGLPAALAAAALIGALLSLMTALRVRALRA